MFRIDSNRGGPLIRVLLAIAIVAGLAWVGLFWFGHGDIMAVAGFVLSLVYFLCMVLAGALVLTHPFAVTDPDLAALFFCGAITACNDVAHMLMGDFHLTLAPGYMVFALVGIVIPLAVRALKRLRQREALTSASSGRSQRYPDESV